MIGRQVRRLALSKVLRGDLRRWMWYIGLTWTVRQVRKVVLPQPELIYKGTLRRGQSLGAVTAKPLPRYLRTRRLRKALAAASREDLASATRGRRR